MSYHFKDSGYPGEDYLIVTKKGKEEGNLPDGIILLGGLMYCDMDFRNWIREAEQNGYYVAMMNMKLLIFQSSVL